ncbi:uncharacterized protein LOC126739666 isoform X2 [Anthonomus grandis grandis]|nr:uncharacterized protein LOC126739666 isoform X2 [Anthonomus grandis grandis]
MAKETTILFLYDSELLKQEEDDPNSAILYFYPTWVSEHQKTALCGQLMGTTLCLKGLFSMPKSISLQTGKFYLIENGKYILVVGTDRNIPSWILEHRAKLIYSLLQFFHKDFISLGEKYENVRFTDKLYHIFDTYLKLLFLGGGLFQHVSLLDIPKPECDDLHLKVETFLDKCKSISNVLGGALLYHNKVIKSQLSAEVTKLILFSDPFRIKNPAELVDSSYQKWSEMKLLQVYITSEEYEELYGNCCEDISTNENNNLLEKNGPTAPLTNNSSVIYSAVPEDAVYSPKKATSKKILRPNSLKLKSISVDSSGELPQMTPNTPYWSHFSTVTTPMSENKSFTDQPDLRTIKEDFWQLSLNTDSSNTTYIKHLRKSKKLSNLIQEGLKRRHHRTYSLTNLKDSISSSNGQLQRSKSVHDPLFPWFKVDLTAVSQYCTENSIKHDIMALVKEKHIKKVVSERKKSLTLPVKPHNASDMQKTDMKSPGGYCTPLMNKLAMGTSQELNIPKPTHIPHEATQKTDLKPALRKCILFLYGYRDMVYTALMLEKSVGQFTSIDQLCHFCAKELPSLEEQTRLCLENKSLKTAGVEPCSLLTVNDEWEATRCSGPWTSSDLDNAIRLHRDFKENEEISEIYLRNHDSILYVNRVGPTENYYRQTSTINTGLLPQNDVLATVRETALEQFKKE